METNDIADSKLLFHKLNQETAKINWSELQRHFARGVVVVVARELDLLKVAEQISTDQDNTIKPYLDAQKIFRATDDDARRWNEQNQGSGLLLLRPGCLFRNVDFMKYSSNHI